MEEIHDLLKNGSLKIYQNRNWFSFSIDSLLLANFATVNMKNKIVVDFATGNAPVPLLLSKKTKSKIIGIEIQKDIYELAIKSVNVNNLNKQIEIINDDIMNIKSYLDINSVDLITMNPPYFKKGKNVNLDEHKKIARHEVLFDLSKIVNIANALLKESGRLAVVHRSERLIDLITIFKNNNIEPKKLQFVYSKYEKDKAILILLEGAKNGKPGIDILKPLYISDELGNYTEDIVTMFGG